MTRREFLAVAGVGPAVATLPAKDVNAMLPVIDTHQHLWDLTHISPRWIPRGSPLVGRHGPEEYAETVKGLNVVKSVYMEVALDADQQRAEADYIVELCESGRSTTCAAVIGGIPASDNFAAYIKPYKGHKYVKGVRQILHVETTPAGYCHDPKFVAGVRLLGELGLSFDLCTRPAEIPDMAKLVDQCPDTRFILDHCGNPNHKFTSAQWDQWRRDLAEIARRTNVVCKVSGFIVNGYEPGNWTADDLAPVVNGTIEAFGWDRVIFGGDWPVVKFVATFREWLTALRQIIADRPEANQRKLLHDNAAAFYGI